MKRMKDHSDGEKIWESESFLSYRSYFFYLE